MEQVDDLKRKKTSPKATQTLDLIEFGGCKQAFVAMQRLIIFGFYGILFLGIGCFLLSERFSECTCSFMVQPKSFYRMVGRGWPLEFTRWSNFWVWSHKQDLVSWQNDASLCEDISNSNNQQVSGKSQPHKVFERDVTHIGEPSKYIKNSSQNICSSWSKHLWQTVFFGGFHVLN